MTLQEILTIGKIKPNDENIALISRFIEPISTWLNSPKFKAKFCLRGGVARNFENPPVVKNSENSTNNFSENSENSTQNFIENSENSNEFSEFFEQYSALPYPPLLDPDMINYENSDIKMCWILNIPLPPFYDFIIFGSHAVSLHSGVPAMLGLCGCKTAGRAGEKESFRIYEQFFEQLKEVKKLKDKDECKKIALIVSDLALDDENDKLYSLIPANAALHIVRDPISNIKSLCNLAEQKGEEADFSELDENNEMVARAKRRGKKSLCFTPEREPSELLGDLYNFKVGVNKDDRADLPNASGCEFWMREIYQCFHDGVFERMLVRVNHENIIDLQTSDFIGEKAIKTLSALARKFGFNEPRKEDEWLFYERVSDYKNFLPAPVMLNASAIKSAENKASVVASDEVMLLWLSSRFKADKNKVNITEFFDLPRFFVVEAENDTQASVLTKPENLSILSEFLPKLVSAIENQSKIEKEKHIKESDILEYFSRHYESAELFAGLLEQHLRPLKSKNSDIISSWEHYAKFTGLLEKMRKENANSDSDEYWRYRLVRKNDDKCYAFAKFSKKQLECL